MTQMRHFVTVGTFAAGLALLAGHAAAQTVIGGSSEPSVEVNLDVLNSLGPDTSGNGAGSIDLYGTTTQQAAGNTSGSVLLLTPPAQDTAATTTTTTTTTTQQASGSGSVLLLDQPVTTPPASTSEFTFPAVPDTKPAVPEGATVTTASQTETTAATTTTTTTTVITQPAPEPEPEPVAAAPAMPEPETTVAETTAAAETTTTTSDPFAQIDDMLDEPVAPEEIVVPEPEMEMDTTEVVSLPPAETVNTASGDLQLLFDPGVDSISDADKAELDQLAGRLQDSPDQRIQLRAYASSDDGTASAARRLALARALQVRAYLIENGVRSTRIDVRALGDKVDGSGPLDRIDIVLVES